MKIKVGEGGKKAKFRAVSPVEKGPVEGGPVEGGPRKNQTNNNHNNAKPRTSGAPKGRPLSQARFRVWVVKRNC